MASISARFSQLPCFGIFWISSRAATRKPITRRGWSGGTLGAGSGCFSPRAARPRLARRHPARPHRELIHRQRRAHRTQGTRTGLRCRAITGPVREIEPAADVFGRGSAIQRIIRKLRQLVAAMRSSSEPENMGCGRLLRRTSSNPRAEHAILEENQPPRNS